LRAEICSSTVHSLYATVFADILVRVFEEGTEYFKKGSIMSKLLGVRILRTKTFKIKLYTLLFTGLKSGSEKM